MPDPDSVRGRWQQPLGEVGQPETDRECSCVGRTSPGKAAVAAITANWKTVFNGKAPIPRRLALVQNGQQVAAFVNAQAKTSFGAAAAGSTATVSSVIITSPSQATVHYEVLLLGTPLLKNQVGTAVYLDGTWKVAIASFCGLAYLEYPKGSPKCPSLAGASGVVDALAPGAAAGLARGASPGPRLPVHAAVPDVPGQHGRQRRPGQHPVGPARRGLRAAVGGRGLRPDVRQLHAGLRDDGR